jgi:CheY-like chemotaxis protein
MKPQVAVEPPPETPDFAVLWVDDNAASTKTFKDTVDQWFNNNHREMKFNITSAESVEEALKIVRKDSFDLIITDNNFGTGKPNGSVLVDKLRRRSTYTDVIFYTRLPEIPPDILAKVSKAGFTYVTKDSELVATAQLVIQERLDRLEKVSYLRGMVITAFIDIEGELNDLLMEYFPVSQDRGLNFRSSILENRNVSFRAKLDALLMIMYGKLRYNKKDSIMQPFHTLEFKTIQEGIQKLREVEEHRNYLAHCVILPGDKLRLVSMGSTVIYSRKDVKYVLQQIRESSQFLSDMGACLGSAAALQPAVQPASSSQGEVSQAGSDLKSS